MKHYNTAPLSGSILKGKSPETFYFNKATRFAATASLCPPTGQERAPIRGGREQGAQVRASLPPHSQPGRLPTPHIRGAAETAVTSSSFHSSRMFQPHLMSCLNVWLPVSQNQPNIERKQNPKTWDGMHTES